MALVPIRIDRTSKPPLGTPLRSDGHWSVEGLVGAWAFNEGAGRRLFNIGSGAKGNATYSTSSKSLGPRGAAFNTGGESSSIITCDSNVGVGSANQMTYIVHTNLAAIGSTMGLVSCYAGGPYLRVGGDGKMYFLASQTAQLGGGNTSLSANTDYVLAVTSNLDKKYCFYVNGKPDGSGAHSHTFSTSNPMLFGADSLGYSDYFMGYISAVFAYVIALSQQEIKSLSANPWQIFEPQTIWIEIPDDAGGGTTYSDTLTALAESYASVTDVATYVDAATALITAGVDAASAITMTEAVLTTAQAADTVSDTMQRVEAVLSVVQAADTVQDAVAAVESLLTTATESGSVTDSVSSANGENVTSSADAVITVADVQAMGEQILASANVTATTADTAAMGESVSATATTAATVQDVVVMLEQVSSQLEAQASATDEVVHGVAENLLASVEAITSVNDLQLMTDNLCIMAQSGASIGEIGSYLEQIATAATAGASVTDTIVGALTYYSEYIFRLPSEQRICRLPSEQRIIAIPSERRICRLTRSSL